MPYYSQYFPFTVLPVVLAGLYFVFEKRLEKTWMRWAWWICSILILLVVGWYASQNPSWYDFYKGYYHSGRKIINKPDLLYDEACYGYVNFPLLAYVFVPLSNLPKALAGALFFLAGYISILPLAYWLVKFSNLKGWLRFIILALLAVSGPLDYSVWLGNTTHMIMLVLLIALWLFKQGWHWLSGILFGSVGLIKIPLILPAGYFFIRRQWRVVGGGLLIVLAVLGLSLWLIPFSLNSTWLSRCILSSAGHPVAAYNNQSAIGFFAREFMPGNLGWDLLTPTSEYKFASNIALFFLYMPVFAMLILGRNTSRTKNVLLLEFFIFLVCSLLTSPISWTHYFVLLLAPISFYLADDSLKSNKAWLNILLWIGAVLITLPVKLEQALFEMTNQSLLLSLHFVGGLLLYVVLFLAWVDVYRQSRRTIFVDG